jgi:hypothetical protein
MAPKWTDLQQMSDEDLIAAHDLIASSTVVGLGYYRDEISRRAFMRPSEAAQELAAAALEEARMSRRLAKWNMIRRGGGCGGCRGGCRGGDRDAVGGVGLSLDRMTLIVWRRTAIRIGVVTVMSIDEEQKLQGAAREALLKAITKHAGRDVSAGTLRTLAEAYVSVVAPQRSSGGSSGD